MKLLSLLDNKIALAHHKLFPFENGLIIVLFHCIFKTEEESKNSMADPQQSITVSDFETVVTYYLKRNYKFLSQYDFENGIPSHGKLCFLTFDDGYFNNQLVLPILEKYRVPATFYFSTRHILEQRCFWGDVYFRERSKSGIPISQIRKEKAELKKYRVFEIEKKLEDTYGIEAFKPVDDTDRPFSRRELETFSKHPLVSIGNHTHFHKILTKCDDVELRECLRKSQGLLREMVGYEPPTIAYPNGDIDENQIKIIRELGFKAGLTTKKGINHLPFSKQSDDAYLLKRYTPWHDTLSETLPLSEINFYPKKAIKKIILCRT